MAVPATDPVLSYKDALLLHTSGQQLAPVLQHRALSVDQIVLVLQSKLDSLTTFLFQSAALSVGLF